MLVGEALRELVDHRIERQRLLDERRHLDQPLHEAALALRVGGAVLRERDHEHAERGELRGERLGRGHADLRARAREHHELGFAHQRAFGHVADGERRQIAGLLREAQRGERVGRLARLRDRDEQRILRHHRIAIAVFARDLDRARQLADLLDEIARDDARVDSSCRRRRCARARCVLKTSVAAGPNAASSNRPFATRSGSVSATARGCSWISLSMKWRYWPFSAASADSSLSRTGRSTVVAVLVENLDGRAADVRDVAFFEEHEAARDGQQRGDVRGDEVLVDAEADDDRAAFARQDDALRIVLADDRERVGAFELGDRGAHGLEQVLLRLAGDGACDARSLRCRSRR